MTLTKQEASGQPSTPHGTNGNLRGFAVLDVYPQPASSDAPDHTPERVARCYQQARNALNRGDWDAAGGMARKALDVATIEIDESLRSDTLWKRIEMLASKNKLDPLLKEWAHAIREDGNNAAHDPDLFTEEGARQICDFAETFLEYAFTMPGKLAERKAKFASGQSSPTPPESRGGSIPRSRQITE